jgi:hypothetical protein
MIGPNAESPIEAHAPERGLAAPTMILSLVAGAGPQAANKGNATNATSVNATTLNNTFLFNCCSSFLRFYRVVLSLLL